MTIKQVRAISSIIAISVFCFLLVTKSILNKPTLTANFNIGGYTVLNDDESITPFRELQDIEDDLNLQYGRIMLSDGERVDCSFRSYFDSDSSRDTRPLLKMKCKSENSSNFKKAIELTSKRIKEFDAPVIKNIQNQKKIALKIKDSIAAVEDTIFNDDTDIRALLKYQKLVSRYSDSEKYIEYEIKSFNLYDSHISSDNLIVNHWFLIMAFLFSFSSGYLFYLTEKIIAASKSNEVGS